MILLMLKKINKYKNPVEPDFIFTTNKKETKESPFISLYYSSTIASTGHTPWQEPQSMQVSGSM